MSAELKTAPAAPAAAAGAPPARSWQRIVLLDDDELLIEWHQRTPAQDTVVVTFDPIGWGLNLVAFGGEFLRKSGADTIAVRKKREHFYQPLSRERFLELVGPALMRYRRRLAYGSSLGAYAVLYYGLHGFDAVVASSPRNSAHPRLGLAWFQQQAPFQHAAFDPDEPGTSPAWLFYDPRDATDRAWAQDEIRPAWRTLTLLEVPWAGHPSNQYLSEIDYIAPFMRAMVAGTPLPPLHRRERGRSGMYLHVLALECLRRRKPRWALALARRAVQRSPGLALAERALAEVALAHGLAAEAAPLLRSLAQRLPADTGVQAMLTRAEGLLAAAPPPAAGSAPTPASPPTAEAAAVTAAAATPAPMPAPAPTSAQAPAAAAPPSPTAADTARRVAAPPAPAARPAASPSVPLLQRLRQGLRRRTLAWVYRLPMIGGVTRNDVLWCYRELLGREPESDEVVARHMLAGSHRRLVQSFIGSPEFARRVRRDAPEKPRAPTPITSTTPADTPDSPPPENAAAAGAPRPLQAGATVVVVGNCQAPGIATVLRCITDIADAVPVTVGGPDERVREQMAAQGPRAALWLAPPGHKLAREGYERHAAPGARWFGVPLLQFSAFHPDVCYAGSRQTQALTKTHYNSALVVWGYANGLDEAETAALFRREVYRAVGYLDAWAPSVAALRHLFSVSDLRDHFADFMLHVQRQGCFMHTPNHPQLGAVAQLSRLVAQQAGLKLQRTLDAGELVDGLNSTIWPVYPEIAQELGVGPGSTTWKLLSANRYIDGVPAFVAQAYQDYREQGIAPADLEMRYRDGKALDAALRRLTGRA